MGSVVQHLTLIFRLQRGTFSHLDTRKCRSSKFLRMDLWVAILIAFGIRNMRHIEKALSEAYRLANFFRNPK